MKIKDNSSKTKEECVKISGIINKIADKTLEELEREGVFVYPNLIVDSKDISTEQMVLQGYNDTYRTGNVMGFLGLGDERLIIESRFSKGENDFFFQYLLEKVMEFPNVINLETTADRDEQLFNWLLFLFPRYLKNAIRKGIFKTYLKKEYNDENIKGTIEVARHIKKNIPFIGKIAYSQREYSYDNYLVELIRHTIEFIKRKQYGNKILEQINDEVKLIIQATADYSISDRQRIIELNKKNIVRHAYYHEYRELQQLCILILQNEKHQMGVGSNSVFGILFDGAWLWEEYLNMLIGDAYYHPMNKAKNGAQKLFTNDKGYKKGRIYPDFISKDATNRVIADAKYKPVENIASHDYLQVLAYMFRFDANKGYYLYPDAEGKQSEVLWLNKGTLYESNESCRTDISVEKYGLKIPQNADSYNQFVKEIQIAEEQFKLMLSAAGVEL